MRVMMKIMGWLLPAAVLAFFAVPQALAADKPALKAGMGKYVMVLWEPGAPIPGQDSPGHIKKVSEPDIEKIGGKLLHKKDNRRVIELPLAAAKELRRHEAVVYLQRIWMGESLEGWDERYSSGTRLTPETDADTDLEWGPKAYTYDGSGNIKDIGTDHYAYDSAGRLIQATVSGKTETFKYDAFGNLIEKGVTGANAVVIPVDGSSNRLTDVNYDVAGNATTGKGHLQYTFDAFNMITQVSGGGGSPRQMVYDANDERIGTLIDLSLSRWTIRDFDGQIIREYKADSAGSQMTWYWAQDHIRAGGVLVGGEKQEWGYTQANQYGGPRHYHLDHLGSVRMLTDPAGRSLAEHDYYPFGTTSTLTHQEELSPDVHVDGMRFAGHWRDFLGYLNVENNDYLDYMHARYYDPNKARFLSVDPEMDLDRTMRQPQAWNRYSYVVNNPVRFTDPTGRCFWDVCVGEGAALWAAGAALAATTTVWLNSSSPAHPGRTNGQMIVDTVQSGLSILSEAVRPLGERWRDFRENPEKWVKVDERYDPRQPPKGKSVREVWENTETGETIGVHVKEPDDKKTRGGEPKHPHPEEPKPKPKDPKKDPKPGDPKDPA